MSPGPSGSWDQYGIYSDQVLQTGGGLMLYYSGLTSSDTAYAIGLATSNDGRSWVRSSANPVLAKGSPGEWDDVYVGAASVLLDGGTYRMWYCGNDGAHWRIGYATSPDGVQWTKYAKNPVMDIGPPNSWDDEHLVFPDVIKDGDAFLMYFGGMDTSGTSANIGLATSPDGIAWTEYAQNPVLSRGGTGESMAVNGPNVMKRDGRYLMWYNGYNGVVWSISHATSKDGVLWTKYGSNPVLKPGAGFESDDVYLPCVWFNGTTYFMIYTGVGSGLSHAFGRATGNTIPYPPYKLQPSSLAYVNQTRPALNWTFRDPDITDKQSAFELEVAVNLSFSTPEISTGKRLSSNTSFVPETDLADGVHYWRVRAWDEFGDNGTWSEPGMFAIDTVPPGNPVNLTSTTHRTGVWSAGEVVDVTWELPPAGDVSGFAGFSALWDRSPDTVPDCELVLPAGALFNTSPALLDGSDHYFHIRSRDGAGNWAPGAAHLGPFFIDASLPENPKVECTSHRIRTWSADNTVDISIKAPRPGLSGIEGYAILWDTMPSNEPGPSVNLSVETSATTSPPLRDGDRWYFHLRTKNNCDVWSAGPVHLGPFYIDTTPPGVAEPVINSGANATSDRQVILSFSASDPVPGSGVEMMRFREPGVGDWTEWEPVDTRKGFELAGGDGERTVSVQVRDRVGNTGAPANASILLDTTPPSAVIVAIEDVSGRSPAGLTSGRPVRVRLNASDAAPGAGVAGMSFGFDGVEWGPWMAFCTTAELTLPAGDGTKAVYVRARDALGSVGDPARGSILLDTAAPVGLRVEINDGDGITNNRTVRLRLEAADPPPGSGTAQMSFSENGTSWSMWEPFGPTRAYTFGSDGNLTLRFRVRDRAGNQAGPVNASILVDSSLPVIESLKVLNVRLRNATLEILTNEPCRVTVEYGAGKEYDQVVETDNFSRQTTVLLSRLRPGQTYHFRVSVVDRGGNPPTVSPDRKFATRPDVTTSADWWYWLIIIAAVLAPAAVWALRRKRRLKTDPGSKSGD